VFRPLGIDPPILFSDYPISEAEIAIHSKVEGLSEQAYCDYIYCYIQDNKDTTLKATASELQQEMNPREKETAAGIFHRLSRTSHQKKIEVAAAVSTKDVKAHSKLSEVIVATARQVFRQLGLGGRIKWSRDNGMSSYHLFLLMIT
jgi:hypothetical protein